MVFSKSPNELFNSPISLESSFFAFSTFFKAILSIALFTFSLYILIALLCSLNALLIAVLSDSINNPSLFKILFITFIKELYFKI